MLLSLKISSNYFITSYTFIFRRHIIPSKSLQFKANECKKIVRSTVNFGLCNANKLIK